MSGFLCSDFPFKILTIHLWPFSFHIVWHDAFYCTISFHIPGHCTIAVNSVGFDGRRCVSIFPYFFHNRCCHRKDKIASESRNFCVVGWADAVMGRSISTLLKTIQLISFHCCQFNGYQRSIDWTQMKNKYDESAAARKPHPIIYCSESLCHCSCRSSHSESTINSKRENSTNKKMHECSNKQQQTEILLEW